MSRDLLRASASAAAAASAPALPDVASVSDDTGCDSRRSSMGSLSSAGSGGGGGGGGGGGEFSSPPPSYFGHRFQGTNDNEFRVPPPSSSPYPAASPSSSVRRFQQPPPLSHPVLLHMPSPARSSSSSGRERLLGGSREDSTKKILPSSSSSRSSFRLNLQLREEEIAADDHPHEAQDDEEEARARPQPQPEPQAQARPQSPGPEVLSRQSSFLGRMATRARSWAAATAANVDDEVEPVEAMAQAQMKRMRRSQQPRPRQSRSQPSLGQPRSEQRGPSSRPQRQLSERPQQQQQQPLRQRKGPQQDSPRPQSPRPRNNIVQGQDQRGRRRRGQQPQPQNHPRRRGSKQQQTRRSESGQVPEEPTERAQRQPLQPLRPHPSDRALRRQRKQPPLTKREEPPVSSASSSSSFRLDFVVVHDEAQAGADADVEPPDHGESQRRWRRHSNETETETEMALRSRSTSRPRMTRYHSDYFSSVSTGAQNPDTDGSSDSSVEGDDSRDEDIARFNSALERRGSQSREDEAVDVVEATTEAATGVAAAAATAATVVATFPEHRRRPRRVSQASMASASSSLSMTYSTGSTSLAALASTDAAPTPAGDHYGVISRRRSSLRHELPPRTPSNTSIATTMTSAAGSAGAIRRRSSSVSLHRRRSSLSSSGVNEEDCEGEDGSDWLVSPRERREPLLQRRQTQLQLQTRPQPQPQARPGHNRRSASMDTSGEGGAESSPSTSPPTIGTEMKALARIEKSLGALMDRRWRSALSHRDEQGAANAVGAAAEEEERDEEGKLQSQASASGPAFVASARTADESSDDRAQTDSGNDDNNDADADMDGTNSGESSRESSSRRTTSGGFSAGGASSRESSRPSSRPSTRRTSSGGFSSSEPGLLAVTMEKVEEEELLRRPWRSAPSGSLDAVPPSVASSTSTSASRGGDDNEVPAVSPRAEEDGDGSSNNDWVEPARYYEFEGTLGRPLRDQHLDYYDDGDYGSEYEVPLNDVQGRDEGTDGNDEDNYNAADGRVRRSSSAATGMSASSAQSSAARTFETTSILPAGYDFASSASLASSRFSGAAAADVGYDDSDSSVELEEEEVTSLVEMASLAEKYSSERPRQRRRPRRRRRSPRPEQIVLVRREPHRLSSLGADGSESSLVSGIVDSIGGTSTWEVTAGATKAAASSTTGTGDSSSAVVVVSSGGGGGGGGGGTPASDWKERRELRSIVEKAEGTTTMSSPSPSAAAASDGTVVSDATAEPRYSSSPTSSSSAPPPKDATASSAAAVAAADSSSLVADHFDKGVSLLEQGNPHDAKPHLIFALKERIDAVGKNEGGDGGGGAAKAAAGHPLVASALEKLGNACADMGQVEEAHVFLCLALRSLRMSAASASASKTAGASPGGGGGVGGGGTQSDFGDRPSSSSSSNRAAKARIYVSLGDLYFASSNFTRALKLYEKSLALRSRLLPPPPSSPDDGGKEHEEGGEGERDLEQRQEWESARRAQAESAGKATTVHEVLASLAIERRDYDMFLFHSREISWLTKYLPNEHGSDRSKVVGAAAYEHIDLSLCQEDREIAGVVSRLGSLRFLRKKEEEGEEEDADAKSSFSYRKEIDRLLSLRGNDVTSERILKILDAVAVFHQSQRENECALNVYLEKLHLLRRLEDHEAAVADAYCQLGFVSVKVGRHRGAIKFLARALRAKSKVRGRKKGGGDGDNDDDDVRLLHRVLGSLHLAVDTVPTALRHFKEYVKSCDGDDAADVFYAMGILHSKIDNVSEALDCLANALKEELDGHPDDDTRYLLIQNLTVMFLSPKKFALSADLHERACDLADMKAVLINFGLTQLSLRGRRSSHSKGLVRDLSLHLERTDGAIMRKADPLGVLKSMGNLLFRRCRYKEAIDFYERFLQGLPNHLSSEDELTVLTNLATSYFKAGRREKSAELSDRTLRELQRSYELEAAGGDLVDSYLMRFGCFAPSQEIDVMGLERFPTSVLSAPLKFDGNANLSVASRRHLEAVKLCHEGDVDKAIHIFQGLLDGMTIDKSGSSLDYIKLYMDISNAYLLKGDLPQSSIAIHSALELINKEKVLVTHPVVQQVQRLHELHWPSQ